MYRFAVEAKPGVPAKLTVEEEHIERQTVALTNLDQNSIQYFLSAKVIGEKVKAALAEVVKRKHELQQVVAERNQCQQRIAAIEQRPVPHPREHGPARPQQRHLQTLREEV